MPATLVPILLYWLWPCKDDVAGLNVCLHCFNGGCAGNRDHALLHYKRFGHSLALNIRRTPKQVQVQPPNTYWTCDQWFSPLNYSATSLRRRFQSYPSQPKQKRIDMTLLRQWCAIRALMTMWTKPVASFLLSLKVLWLQWLSQQEKRSKPGSKSLSLASIPSVWFNRTKRKPC